jgi:hypothetical protein
MATDIIRSLNEISRIRLYMFGSISIWPYPLRKTSCFILCRTHFFLRKSPRCSIFNLWRSEIFECPIWTEQMTCSLASAQAPDYAIWLNSYFYGSLTAASQQELRAELLRYFSGPVSCHSCCIYIQHLITLRHWLPSAFSPHARSQCFDN